jgi:pyruvate-formate lyase
MLNQETERITKLRRWVMSHEPSVCHERAVIVTDVYTRSAGELPLVLLRAQSLAAVLDGMSIFIGPDELIVGNQASRPRAAPVFPEYSWEWVQDELDSLSEREADRFLVPPETKERLRAILPRWRGRSLRERALRALPDEVLHAQETLVFLLTSMSCAVGHLAPDYSRVLNGGLEELINQAQSRLEALDLTDPAALKQRDFYRAAVEVGRAAIRFARRYADLALRMGEDEVEPPVARSCRKSPGSVGRSRPTLPEAFMRPSSPSGSPI